MENEEKKKLTIDKILTISGDEWCKSNGTRLEDYNCVGVRAYGDIAGIWSGNFHFEIENGPAVGLSKMAPKGTEVIVGFFTTISSIFHEIYFNPRQDRYYSAGTALIPKQK